MNLTKLNPVKHFSVKVPNVSYSPFDKATTQVHQYLMLPNGKVADNMLDTFIAATGTKVEGYAPNKIVDFIF